MNRLRMRIFASGGIVGLVLLVLACGGGGASSSSNGSAQPSGSVSAPAAPTTEQQSNSPAAPAPPAAARNVAPDGNRIFEDARFLSESPRASGTAREREASEFIADKLRAVGYDVSFQE